ncbi:ras-domain-containing protein [Sporormia fimetaria CBS 119925]|uniref:Ras-domain-containing protein n=1 Tax=Sporormia fimetaria CBS 119925 TaxID=1340428 RepID=A0A6A6VLB9_9PLEO|nr:ras-domain-containing protein [Sporormia fimetaria CBS 119925]
MYDYLAKIILLGPSGAGKSCLLHRFLHSTFRPLTSQTIGVEFASKIISIPDRRSRSPRKRIKLQLWDTAGTERFRSVSRSYYRGAAGALLVYDVSSWRSFEGLDTFLRDARALASRELVVLVVGNKCDVNQPGGGRGEEGREEEGWNVNAPTTPTMTPTPSSVSSSLRSHTSGFPVPGQSTYTVAPFGAEVPSDVASAWASENGIPVAVEVSALSGEGVEELFTRLARMILTKIELGEIDPDDPSSGIQYGDIGWAGDEGSVDGDAGEGVRLRRRGRRGGQSGGGMGEWEEVFRLGGRRRGGRCC